MIKYIYYAIVFSLELAMIASFAYFGYVKGNSTLLKFTLAIALSAIAIFLWGYFAAPRSSHRLTMPYLALFRGVLFLVASFFLYKCNKINTALVIALLSVATQTISYFLKD